METMANCFQQLRRTSPARVRPKGFSLGSVRQYAVLNGLDIAATIFWDVAATSIRYGTNP